MMAIFQRFNELPLGKKNKKKKRKLKPINLSGLTKKRKKKSKKKTRGSVGGWQSEITALHPVSYRTSLQTAENLGENQAQSTLSGELPGCSADILQTQRKLGDLKGKSALTAFFLNLFGVFCSPESSLSPSPESNLGSCLSLISS